MPVAIDETFRRGGRALVDLLDYLVISFQMDPLFLFLIGKYRIEPTAFRALALYDVFCAPKAEARISAVSSVPPRDARLRGEIEVIRAARQRAVPRAPGGEHALGPVTPAPLSPMAPLAPLAPKYLFDTVADEVTTTAAHALASISQSYDPARSPHENLPEGRMTAGQRVFVDQVWQPRLRPYLVAAGFRQIANVG